MKATAYVLILVAALLPAAHTSAQETALAFEGLKAGAGEPVEITADQLQVTQQESTAEFTGNVLVIQGGLRLSSDTLTVEYVEGDKTRIDRLIAEGNVLLSTPAEAAQGTRAVYVLTSQELEMTGDVVLTQGGNVMSGERLLVNIAEGTGRMDGRVRTILQPAGN
jgi:lipopolysaccharide export system protein LptA